MGCVPTSAPSFLLPFWGAGAAAGGTAHPTPIADPPVPVVAVLVRGARAKGMGEGGTPSLVVPP